MMRFTVMLFTLLFFVVAQGQNAVFQEVNKARSSGLQFQENQLLKFYSANVLDRTLKLEGLSRGTVLSIEHESIEALVSNRSDYIEMPLPVSDRSSVNLLLVRHEILAEDFALFTSDLPGVPVDYTPGVHYKGIVEGDPNSLVAISVFNDEIMGMISTAKGNLVLGRINDDRESRHILYNDTDLERKSDFECGTADDGLPYSEEDLSPNPGGRDVGDCVRVYIEIDDDIVTQKGGATPATNYITGLFNQSFVLYTNEVVTLTISQILAWTTNSPYTGTTASQMLTSFQNNSGEFNGNIGHLVSYQASGGIAVLDGMCQTNPDWRKCFSSIDATYQNVPTYSWSVMVVTHEMGHVIGSKHTHACVWNGNNTAIDGCAGSVEGSCPLPPIPPEGGTIMSYCHIQNVGIDFNLGFGPQPGNVIRNKVNATNNCLTACGAPPPPPPPAYCASNGTSSLEWINKVVLGSINNTSGNNNGYGNYTSLTTNLTKGSSYTINLTPGFPSGSYVEAWKVWIDYNGDLDWADAGEMVGQGSGSSTVNITFTVPAGNATVTTRMRVSMKYNAYPPNCGSYTYGEVEDYTVSIVASSGGTCYDGIQNQGETGIDCGGPCAPCPPPPPPPPPPGGNILLASYFETGWDSWIDGGSDANRVSSSNSYEGTYSIRLADNSGVASSMTSPSFNVSSGVIGLQIQFYFYAYSMETGEDFVLQYKNGNTAWVTIASYIKGVNFNNNIFYSSTVTVPNFVPTSDASFRIKCDASDNADQIYVDQVTITKITSGGLIEEGVIIEEVDAPVAVNPVDNIQNPDDARELLVFPNPVQDFLNISFDGTINAMRVLAIDGQEMKIAGVNYDGKMIDISHLAQGIYFLWVESDGQWYPTKFSKM